VIVLLFVHERVNEEKFAAHGVTAFEVDQVLASDYVVIRNRKGRTGSHLLIGRSYGGRCITIPITPTDDPTIWRPVTAWPCKPAEERRLRD
jgi:hypothetical protein